MDTNPANDHFSNINEDLLNLTPEYTLYSLNQLALATFLGGPFAGFYMIYYNLKKLGLNNRIWRAAAIIFGVVILSFMPEILGYEDGFPGLVYSMAYAISTYYAGKYVMENPVIDHEKSEGKFFSGGRVALVIIINIVVIVAIIALGLILTDLEGFKEFLNG